MRRHSNAARINRPVRFLPSGRAHRLLRQAEARTSGAWLHAGGYRASASNRQTRTGPVSLTNAGFYNLGAGTEASVYFYDFQITGPPGQVTTSLNLKLSGTADAGSTSPGLGTEIGAGSIVQVSFQMIGVTGLENGVLDLEARNGSLNQTGSGMLRCLRGTIHRLARPRRVRLAGSGAA